MPFYEAEIKGIYIKLLIILLKVNSLVIWIGNIRNTTGINSMIEMEEISKRKPKRMLSINFTKPILLNNSGYE